MLVLVSIQVVLWSASARAHAIFVAVAGGMAVACVSAVQAGSLAILRDGPWHPTVHRRVSRASGLLAALSFAVLASVGLSQWPLRLAFLLSRESLDRLADRIEQGHVLGAPEWVGLFYVCSSELHGSSEPALPCLWTDPDPSGDCGLVRCSPGEARSRFNLWSLTELDERWQLVTED